LTSLTIRKTTIRKTCAHPILQNLAVNGVGDRISGDSGANKEGACEILRRLVTPLTWLNGAGTHRSCDQPMLKELYRLSLDNAKVRSEAIACALLLEAWWYSLEPERVVAGRWLPKELN